MKGLLINLLIILASSTATALDNAVDDGASPILQLPIVATDTAGTPDPAVNVPEPLSDIDKCKNDLKAFFQNPADPNVKKYLALQAEITAHRLAWAYMILRQKKGAGLEGIIKDLIKKREDPKLKQIYDEFRYLDTHYSARDLKKYKEQYYSREENQGRSTSYDLWTFRKLRMEQLQHSLIAASMSGMRATLMKDYAVPADSPFLLQQEDINLGSLLDTVASKQDRRNALSKMTNLMETVDRSYDMRENTAQSMFKTQWQTATPAKRKQGARAAGYSGELTGSGAEATMGASGTHHRTQAEKILEEIKKVHKAMADMLVAIRDGITSCRKDDTWKTLIGACPGDTPELLGEKFVKLAENGGMISRALTEKYEKISESTGRDITDALSQSGTVLANSDFNAKNFCDNPAKFICDSTDSRASKAAEGAYDKIVHKSYNEGTKAFRKANHMCLSGPNYGDACNSGQGCTCGEADSCTDYNNMQTRKGCYDAQFNYQNSKLMTPARKRNFESQFQKAKNDIKNLFDKEPLKAQIPAAQRANLIQVIKDTTIQYPTRADYTWTCDSEDTTCTKDSDCDIGAGDGTTITGQCIVKDIDWNMYANFSDLGHTGPNAAPYSTNRRATVTTEGMIMENSDTMYGILLHEVAHLVTSKDFVDDRMTGVKVGGNHPFKAQRDCYQGDELSAHSLPADRKVDEAMADGLQAQVIGLKMEGEYPQTSPARFNPRAIEYVRRFVTDNCNHLKLAKTSAELTAARTARSAKDHPYSEDRINRIVFANKYIMQATGCDLASSKKTPPKYSTPLRQCISNP